MTKDKKERREWLINVIKDHPKITLREIEDRYNHRAFNDDTFSLATFKRDIKAIYDEYHIVIKCRRQREYSYYYIDGALTSNEILQQRFMQRLSNDLLLKSLLRDGASSSDMNGRIQIETVPKDDNLLPIVLKAMKERTTISFVYADFWDGEPNRHEMEPYILRQAQRRWYVAGPEYTEGAMMSFSLDRMSELEQTTNSFSIPSDFDAKAFFRYSYGAMTDKETELVRLRVWGEQALYLDSNPLHWSQRTTKTENGYAIFELKIRPTYDLKMEIASHGSSWEVLSPKWFRDEVASYFQMAYRLYYPDHDPMSVRAMSLLQQTLTSLSNQLPDCWTTQDDVSSEDEPNIVLTYHNGCKDTFDIVFGYENYDGLYYGIRWREHENEVLKSHFDLMHLNIALPLHADNWYGWAKASFEEGRQLFEQLLKKVRTLLDNTK